MCVLYCLVAMTTLKCLVEAELMATSRHTLLNASVHMSCRVFWMAKWLALMLTPKL